MPTLVIANSTDSPGWPENGPYIATMVPGAQLTSHTQATAICSGMGLPMRSCRPSVASSPAIESADRKAVFDRVLATVLFTDIVDSTAQAAAVGDHGWRATRERHDQLVRTHLSSFSGREVKTMGDGFLVTFDGPARAVRCAQAIVTGARDLGIEVRAGLHTGEIELDGDDVAGIAVAIGARVGALAGAGTGAGLPDDQGSHRRIGDRLRRPR